MLRLPLTGIDRVLCLGAHSDDIEIGCGGTVLQLIEQQPAIEIRWVTFSASPERAEEARVSAGLFLAHAARRTVDVLAFRDGFFPFTGGPIKDCFEGLKRAYRPDLVLTHAAGDRHQDHRLISQLTWNTYRHDLILEYEIVKYDGGLEQPNVYVPLSQRTLDRKVQYLTQAFTSQAHRDWFDAATFQAIARLRGVECRAPSGYAEAFIGRKLVL